MATLTPQKASLAGLEPTYATADSDGDEFSTTGDERLHVRNGGESSITVTIASAPCQYGGSHPITVTVPADEERVVGPFPPSRFAVGGGPVGVSYSAVTDVTVAVLA